MPVFYKSLYMKFEPRFDPKLPKDVSESKLISTYLQRRELPTIEMTMAKDSVVARAVFKFTYNNKIYSKIFLGPQDIIYKASARQASKIGLNLERQFNSEWNKTLMQLMNTPAKDRAGKSILNLGVYKNNTYGLYDVSTPSELLNQKIIESGMSLKQVAQLAEINETTLFRHLKGTFEISRDVAIKYAKALGCDPAEILFNNLNIPVWGSTDTQEMRMLNKFSVYASEITVTQEIDNVNCPREIYRPDVKAIAVDCPNSGLHGHIAYYYNSVEPLVFENQIVIVGAKIKNFHDDETRLRYFIGTYKKNRNGRTVDIHSIDPAAIDISGVEPDEDMNSYEDFVGLTEDQRIVVEDIKPEFVAPVVALISNSKMNDPMKAEILKAYDEIYTRNRKQDFESIEQFKKLAMNAALQGKAFEHFSDYFNVEEKMTDDVIEDMTNRKIQNLIKANKRFEKVLSTAAYGPAKREDRVKLQEEVKQLKIELSKKEQQIVDDAIAAIEDDIEYQEAQNQEPMDLPDAS